jgi:hypothetical protein
MLRWSRATRFLLAVLRSGDRVGNSARALAAAGLFHQLENRPEGLPAVPVPKLMPYAPGHDDFFASSEDSDLEIVVGPGGCSKGAETVAPGAVGRADIVGDSSGPISPTIFPAHKLVLKSGSPYFRRMLRSELLESKSGRIFLPEDDPEIIRRLLQFLYTGDTSEAVVDAEHAQALLQASERLNVPALKLACEHFLSKQLTSQNALEMMQLARSQTADELAKACVMAVVRDLPFFVGSLNLSVEDSAAWSADGLGNPVAHWDGICTSAEGFGAPFEPFPSAGAAASSAAGGRSRKMSTESGRSGSQAPYDDRRCLAIWDLSMQDAVYDALEKLLQPLLMPWEPLPHNNVRL